MKMCKIEKNSGIFITYLTFFHPQSYKVSTSPGKNTKFPVKTVQHYYVLEIWLRSLKMIWTNKAQWAVKFLRHSYTWPTKNNVYYLQWINSWVTQVISCIIFLMYTVATTQCLKHRKQDSKTRNLQFISLTHLWPSHKVKVMKSRMTM